MLLMLRVPALLAACSVLAIWSFILLFLSAAYEPFSRFDTKLSMLFTFGGGLHLGLTAALLGAAAAETCRGRFAAGWLAVLLVPVASAVLATGLAIEYAFEFDGLKTQPVLDWECNILCPQTHTPVHRGAPSRDAAPAPIATPSPE